MTQDTSPFVMVEREVLERALEELMISAENFFGAENPKRVGHIRAQLDRILSASAPAQVVAWTDDKLAAWARNWHWNDCALDRPVDPSIYFRDRRMLKAFVEAHPVHPVAVRRIPTSNSDVAEALTQAREYFENRADVVDGDYGVPEPNTEMRLAQMCADALTVLPVAEDQGRPQIESSRAAESAETKSAGGEA